MFDYCLNARCAMHRACLCWSYPTIAVLVIAQDLATAGARTKQHPKSWHPVAIKAHLFNASRFRSYSSTVGTQADFRMWGQKWVLYQGVGSWKNKTVQTLCRLKSLLSSFGHLYSLVLLVKLYPEILTDYPCVLESQEIAARWAVCEPCRPRRNCSSIFF